MTTYNNHQQRHEDIDASSQQQQSHEYFKREKRPPYFTSILNDGDASSVKENGFSVGDFRENNGNSREEGILSPKKTNSVGDTDSLADKKPLVKTSSFSSLRSLKESIKNIKEANTQSLQKQNSSNIAALLNSPLLFPRSPLNSSPIIIPTWRLKERMKTVGVCLVLALNIGTDPPDVNRPTPCAKLQCWMDPTVISRAKAREQIGEKLEHQYARWQQRLKLRFKRALDPTVEDVRTLCLNMRRHAKNERLLLHYNGHGVPRPTLNGEIWLFDQKHTQYIPLSISDLRQWIGKPSILVLDCSGAGVLIPFLAAPLEGLEQYMQQVALHPNQTANLVMNIGSTNNPTTVGPGLIPPISPLTNNGGNPGLNKPNNLDESEFASRSVRDCIVFCPCAEGELLPMNPEFPADIFTSCLTTPIPIALRWFVHQNPLSMEGVDPESVDRIPGEEKDRKTPLGELNWIFTAITDTIAWNVLPSPLFQRLFRQDLLVASMFRNFLLADRILRSLNCTPMSLPSLPSTCNHPLWQAWDLAVETCLHQLMRDGHLNMEAVPRGGGGTTAMDPNVGVDDVKIEEQELKANPTRIPNNGNKSVQTLISPSFAQTPTTATNIQSPPQLPYSPNITSPFFAEQLTAFEIWLEFASTRVATNSNTTLLSTANMNENNGMESPEQLPVVLQVLLSQAHRVRALILLKSFLDLGPWAVNLALSVGIFPYVLKLLKSHVDEYKHVLVGIWAKILAFDPSCQIDLVKDSALEHFIGHLNWGLSPIYPESKDGSPPGMNTRLQQQAQHHDTKNKKDAAEQRTMAAFILSIICLDYPVGQTECLKQNLHGTCCDLLLSLEKVGTSIDSPKGRDKIENNGTERRKLSYDKKADLQYKQELDNQKLRVEENVPPEFRLWICICLGNLWKDCNTAQSEAYKSSGEIHKRVYARLEDDNVDVRAAAAYALSCLIGTAPSESERETSNENGFMPGLVPPTHKMIPPPSMRNVALPTMNNYRIPPSSPGIGNFRGGSMDNGQQVLNLVSGMSSMGPVPQIGGLAMPQHQQVPQYHPNGHLVGQVIPGYTPQTNTSHGPLSPPSFLNQSSSPSNSKQSLLFKDSRRLGHDLETADELVNATNDASATVRYEATLALGCLVGKYLSAFAAVANEMSSASINMSTSSNLESNTTYMNEKERTLPGSNTLNAEHIDENNHIEFPPGLGSTKKEHFRYIWKALRKLQHKDPHPAPQNAANDIVSVVHEHILMIKTKSLSCNQNQRQKTSDIQESPVTDQNASNMSYNRTQSMVSMSNPQALTIINHYSSRNLSQSVVQKNKDKSPNGSHMHHINNVSGGQSIMSSMMNASFSPVMRNNVDVENSHSGGLESQFRIEYSLPKSEFLAWKRQEFEEHKKPWTNSSIDPLSPTGAINMYRARRNAYLDEKGRHLEQYFSSLAPKPPQTRDSSRYPYYSTHSGSYRDEKFYEDLTIDEATAAANSKLELEVSDKKKILQLRQYSLLHNEGVKMTSSLRFHSYEPALAVCDESDGISIWDVSKKNNSIDNRVCVFKNRNPAKSRMTSTAWINEESNSMLLVASDDGTVKVWDGLIENGGGLSREKPSLASSFFANPDLVAGQRGSGLITEWQQYSGKLIAGGNSEWIRCWDLEAEKCVNKFNRKEGSACVTTLTTAWDAFTLNGGGESFGKSIANGYSGIGPNIIVAGYGNGSIKVFDIRSSRAGSVMSLGNGNTRSYEKRRKLMEYDEHKSWIVNTLFTGHGGRYEIVSGCVAGDIKFWDLRYSSSMRSLSVQRSQITALAGHPRVPMLVTGSHAQFIKMITTDGETLSVIRYHESSVQRIGPISCLTFHPNRLMFAAGATDETVGIYGPRT